MTSRALAVLGDEPPEAYEAVSRAPEDFSITRLESTGPGPWALSILLPVLMFGMDVVVTWLFVDPSLSELLLPWQMCLGLFGFVGPIAAWSWFAAPRILISPRRNVFEYARKTYAIDELAMTRVRGREIRILRNWTEVIVLPFDWASENSRLRLPEIADHLNSAVLWRERHQAAVAFLERSEQPGGPFRGTAEDGGQSS